MSNNSNNKGVMTEKGREALERFKMEPANGLGINLKQVCNGDLTSREAGSAGSSMVNMMCLEQQWQIPRNSVKSIVALQVTPSQSLKNIDIFATMLYNIS